MFHYLSTNINPSTVLICGTGIPTFQKSVNSEVKDHVSLAHHIGVSLRLGSWILCLANIPHQGRRSPKPTSNRFKHRRCSLPQIGTLQKGSCSNCFSILDICGDGKWKIFVAELGHSQPQNKQQLNPQGCIGGKCIFL